ncbi:thiamine diphosphokinase [Desulfatirhabdium butyrativorans]|uniref:thiamine diphosphokinase n=1 Tax=Desulfatirhabdium butyrativorans TaxID=340467 RepID=UPI000684C16B|nr:thiamine diphosphokinase [Desulfatirhabdium butyrativorans]
MPHPTRRRTVIVANGTPAFRLECLECIQPVDRVIAVDGGYRYCAAMNIRTDTLIGDMDSLDPALLNEARGAVPEILQFPSQKDQTDLELALEHAVVKQGSTEILVFGALGGRWDMSIGNVCLLLHPVLAGIDVCLVADGAKIRLLRGPAAMTIRGKTGDGLSLIALAESARDVCLKGLLYDLDHEDLALGSSRGISNVFLQDSVAIELKRGNLLVIHTRIEENSQS